jgi:hypothetical protein
MMDKPRGWRATEESGYLSKMWCTHPKQERKKERELEEKKNKNLEKKKRGKSSRALLDVGRSLTRASRARFFGQSHPESTPLRPPD